MDQLGGTTRTAAALVGVSELDDRWEMTRALFETAGACAVRVSTRMHILEVTPAAAEMFGVTATDMYQRSFFDFVSGTNVVRLWLAFCRLFNSQQDRFFEQIIGVRSGGAMFPGSLSGLAVRGSVGEVDHVTAIIEREPVELGGQAGERGHELLTGTEARILEGIAAGVSTADLARQLNLSRGGIEYHITRLLRKLGVVNRTALASKAYSLGMIEVGVWPPEVRPHHIK